MHLCLSMSMSIVMIFSTPICLCEKNFSIKQVLNKVLKFMKFLKHVRLEFERIGLGKLTIIINKIDIILFSTNQLGCRPPNIKEFML
jgi:hypothetical protein